MSKDDDGEKEGSGPIMPAAVVTPVRIATGVSKPFVAKSFRPPAAQKPAATTTTEASDGEEAPTKAPAEGREKSKAKTKTSTAAKPKVAKAEKTEKSDNAKPAKVPKDPNLPKAAKSSYMFFSGVARTGKTSFQRDLVWPL